MNHTPALAARKDPLDHFFRCLPEQGQWIFEVGVVDWPSPSEPCLVWKRFRTWKHEPNPARLRSARTAATKRYFRTCTRCGELNNLGHMHDADTCQGCAERYLGVVH